jgi:hypothetical protein
LKTFFEKFLDHEVEVEDIYDAIHKWHNTPGAPKSVSEYLGMSKEQYGIFTGEPPAVVEQKFRKKDLIGASFKGRIAQKYDVEEP